MRKKCIAIVFLFLIYFCWYLPTPDNPVLGFFRHPKQLFWDIYSQLDIRPDNSSESIYKALNEGLKTYRINSIPTYEKLIGANFSHFHGDIQGLLDIRRVGNYAKLNTGHIVRIRGKDDRIDKSLLDEMIQKTERFNSFLQKRDIPFLFVILPSRLHKTDQQFPCHIEDYTNENADRIFQSMMGVGIDCLDIRELFLNNPQKHYQWVFIGDHHWKDEYAFEAFKVIAAKMSKSGNIIVNDLLLNSENYVKSDERFPWQHQSAYRILGIHYTVLEENYDKMIFRMPHNKPVVSDSQNGLIHFHSDNEFSSNKTILIIRDSFFNYMQEPFSLAFKDIYAVDPRSYCGSIAEIISKVSPDYVIFAITAFQLERRIFRFDYSSKFPNSNSPIVNP